jgi:hypothetical protein
MKKEVTIVVNGTPYQVEKEKISYDEVVTLAFPDILNILKERIQLCIKEDMETSQKVFYHQKVMYK